jgi:hypothetical protein
MSILGAIFGAILEPTNFYAEQAEEIGEKHKAKARTVGDNNEYLKQIAKEMGNFQWLAMMEKEDKFIKEQEREDKLKEQEKISDDADKTRVENEYNLFETEATLSTESLINSADKSNLISADSFIDFRDMVDDLLNDTKSNTTIIESMKIFASKNNEVDQQLTKYKNDVKQTKGENNPFSFTATDETDTENDALTTTTENNDSHQQDAFA